MVSVYDEGESLKVGLFDYLIVSLSGLLHGAVLGEPHFLAVRHQRRLHRPLALQACKG